MCFKIVVEEEKIIKVNIIYEKEKCLDLERELKEINIDLENKKIDYTIVNSFYECTHVFTKGDFTWFEDKYNYQKNLGEEFEKNVRKIINKDINFIDLILNQYSNYNTYVLYDIINKFIEYVRGK